MGYVVTSTLFKKRQSLDMTVSRHDSHKKGIMNTKVTPGEECVHGHQLVVMDMH